MEYLGTKLYINYKLVKNITVRIKNNEICVTAPLFDNEETVLKFLDKHQNWIKKRINNKQTFTIWGKEFIPEFIKFNEDKVVIIDDKCYIYYKTDKDISLNKFLASEIKKSLPNIIEKYQETIEKNDLCFNKMTIKKMSSRWGSCVMPKRFISINLNLAKYDPIFLEYVFCHELAHIRYQDHSPRFHNFLQSFFPTEEKVRKELKKCC